MFSDANVINILSILHFGTELSIIATCGLMKLRIFGEKLLLTMMAFTSIFKLLCILRVESLQGMASMMQFVPTRVNPLFLFTIMVEL
jgi:hypothetical protein